TDWLRLPAIVRGGIPGAVDVVLNCQLVTMARWCDIGSVGFGSGLPTLPATFSPPPHPQSRTSAESPKMLAKCFMGLSPVGRVWRSWADDFTRTWERQFSRSHGRPQVAADTKLSE